MDKENKELSQSCELRLIKEEDIPEVASIYVDAFTEADIDEDWTQESAEEFMNNWLDRQKDLFFVAIYEGQIVGGIVAGIKPWWDGKHLIDGELFVRPELQRQGVGTRLFITLLEEAIKKYNIVEIEGLADKGHEFPLKWYKELGIDETSLVHVAGKPQEVLDKLK